MDFGSHDCRKSPRFRLTRDRSANRTIAPADTPGRVDVKSEAMSKVNWSRVLSCGFLTGGAWIILGSIVTALLGRDFAAVPNNRLANPTPAFIVANVAIDFLEGISIIWLYAVLRPVYGVAARTAIIAAFAWWFIVSLGDVTWCSFGLFPARTVIPLMVGTLPALILATLVGAKFYKQ